MQHMQQILLRDDPEYVMQSASALKLSLLDYVQRHGLEVDIGDVPAVVSNISMRDHVYKVSTFADINAAVSRINAFHTHADVGKSTFARCFTSAKMMERANAELIAGVDANHERQNVWVFPPLLLTHFGSEPGMLAFKMSQKDERPAALLMFLATGAVVPVVFDLVAFRTILARYRLYSLVNMRLDEVREYLISAAR